MPFRSPPMLPLFTLLLLASSAIAAVAQPADTEPTKVTKLHANTNTIHVPYQTADVDIHARQLTELPPASIPTWSEPSWVLYGAPTAVPDTPSTPPSTSSSSHQKKDYVSEIVVIAVLTATGGGMVLFGLIGCVIKAYMQRSGNSKGKGKGRGKGKDKATAPKRKREVDVEMTAGLTANAVSPGKGRCAPKPRCFEEMDEIILTPECPEPVYMTDIPPQPCHYPEGEAR